MDEKPTIPKVIVVLLNTILIGGAILSVLTIDRGRWLISNPAFYSPPDAVQSYVLP
jgi:hypothetical protein